MRTEIAKNLVIANKYSNHDYNNQGEENVLQHVRENFKMSCRKRKFEKDT